MPISTESLMLKLNPMSAIDLDGASRGSSSLERERLKLMREQFENQKKQQQEQIRLDREAEAGRMARERMQGQRAKEAAQAAAAAKVTESKQSAYQKFTELNGQGDIEGARAMVPFMSSLGMAVDLEGEEGGLPRYRIEMDAAEAAKREAAAQAAPPGQAAIGYSEEDSGALDEPAGIGSTEEAFMRARDAEADFALTGRPSRGPDQEDFTGAVPKNVLDMGAIQAQTLARLDPALSGLVSAYPQGALRDSAMQTAGAVRGLGLPAAEAVKQFSAQRSGPNSLISSQIEAEATAGRFDQTQRMASGKESEARFKSGFKTLGETMGKTYGVEDLLTAREQTKNAVGILENEKDSDDELVLALISRRMGERGATTEGDIKRVTGMSAMSWIDQAKTWFGKGLEGGLQRPQKDALIGVLREMEKSDNQRFGTFLDKLESEASNPETDPDVARGLRAYGRAFVPQDIRDEREAKKKGSERVPVSGEEGSVVIPKESRIAFEHNNPGNLKFADQTGAEKGEEASDGGHWAKFATPEEGAAALYSQIEKDAGRGQTVREFVTKYAPPGSNDTEKYVADAIAELGAKEDTKLSDIDQAKVAAFVARKESGSTLGGAAPSKTESSQAKSKADRARELLEKARR